MTKVRVRRSQLGFAASCLALLLGARGAVAQSAADKATARNLATEGIELYQAGKYAEALDKLERAESLYDAPVHLLYIARAEQRLGKWVEAAETYRRLVRVRLGADAPSAFQQAIDDGKRELAELEPRIPVLKVEVTPAGVNGLEVSLDGEKIAPAAIGVDRPVDPGEHTLVASAEGYAPLEKKVTLAPGGKEALVMALVPTGEPTAPPPAKTREVGAAEPAPSRVSEKKAGFFVGLRLLGVIPAGQAGVFGIEGGPEFEYSMSDVMNGGGGLGLLGGFRFARHFAGKVYLDLFNMGKGDDLLGESRVSGVEGGLGFTVSTAAHQLGGYGEIGLGFQSFEVQNGFGVMVSDGQTVATCRGDVSLSGGPSFRIGGGGIIPVGKYFHITPFMLASFAQFEKATIKARDCDPAQTELIESIGIVEARGHQLFLLGVGGDWLIGG